LYEVPTTGFKGLNQLIPISRPTPLELYGGILAATTVGLAVLLVEQGLTVSAPYWAIAILAGVAVLAERQPVRVTDNLEMTVSLLPMLFAAVVYGPLDAMLVGAAGLVLDCRPPYIRWIIWTALRGIAGGLAGVVVLMIAQGDSFGPFIAAAAAAVVTQACVDALAGSAVVKLRGSGSGSDFLRSIWRLSLATVPLYTSVLVVLAYAYREVSVMTVALFFGPAFAAHRFYRLYREEREGGERLQAANDRLERANLSFATALVATLDARDRYTAGHSAAVAIYSRDIAERMGLSDEQRQLAHLAGLVHDIGKIGLPAGLLEKPGPLTLEERRHMESHSAIGERILAKVDDYAEIAEIVRHHHERVDGHGYPDGLPQDAIPLISRIISVADAYNAMTSDRPYRDAMPSRVARLRLAQAVESQFDTSVVAAFEAILAAADEDYRSGTATKFSLQLQEDQALRDRPSVSVGVAA
jgi:putative nucleotidyltransferase with HDIG domain